MTRQTAFVIAPGRGSYQADELGYLKAFHKDKKDFIQSLNDLRKENQQTSISELDNADRFVRSRHTNGENASLLICACAMADFMSIDKEKFDIVAIAGNSMGWYLALACSQALPGLNGPHLINHMGTLMHNEGSGGQILYPLVDDYWRPDPEKTKLISSIIKKGRKENHNIFISIQLGGTIVLAADKKGLSYLHETLPPIDRYPMELGYHAAFHSPLLDPIIGMAQAELPRSLFAQPEIPIIDGRGNIWNPGATNINTLYEYTLGTQINQTYDFTSSVEVGLKEFAPDNIIILGPGTTMGPPVAQTIIKHQWWGIDSKERFKSSQKENPKILSMGIEEQRKRVTG